MKKFVAIFLSLVMILAMGINAFAENTTLNITGETRTFAGYQLLTLTTSQKTGNNHPAGCDGTNHSSDCFNYAYSVNEKYRSVLQKETLDNGKNELWLGTGKPTTASAVTDKQILDYLAGQQSDNGDVYSTMRMVADRLYRAIQTAGLAADESSLTDNSTIEQGYWMFADVTTDLAGAAASSLVIVNTAGQGTLTISPKTAIPTVDKKVKDIEDSEDDSTLDNAWQDSADHDIGDVIAFKLTATLPSNARYYTSYEITFHDEMSAGLELVPGSVPDSVPGSFEVFMYETKHKADVDTDMNDFLKRVDEFFTVNVNPTDGCSFEVSCDNVFAIEGVTKDTAFVVCYKAKLTEGAAIGGADGNPNEVYLEFSNNPYGDGTGETEKDKVIVYTYQLNINKTDANGNALQGAGFTLYKKDVDGKYNAIGAEQGGEGSTLTTFNWKGLDDGDYKLEETTVPGGYNKMADVVFSISAEHSAHASDPELTLLDGGLMGTGDTETGIISDDVVNYTGTVLPETGAKGTVMLISCSALVVMMAAVFMITRKKMSVYED